MIIDHLFFVGNESASYISMMSEHIMEDLLVTLLQLAAEKHVSDIHFVWEKQRLSIEFRTMFGMQPLHQDIWNGEFFSYLKYRAKLDLTHPQKPQSGQFDIRLHDQTLYCRFSTILNQNMQTGVLRILHTEGVMTIDQLTDDPRPVRMMRELCHYRQGLVVAIGPTNTGKTTTLHAMLHEIASAHRFKIVSLEDPIEIEDESYIQLQINEAQGFTYEKGIEELLRHDPDIIFIGEIRSAYTAKMVIRAALTGHFVFTTLHAKNCLEGIQRFYNFGLTKYDLTNTLTALIAQRLYACDQKGGKQCIYEILSKQDLRYALEQGAYPAGFETLEKEIRRALAEDRICDPQAVYDVQSF